MFNARVPYLAIVVEIRGQEATITIEGDRYFVANKGFTVGQRGYAFHYPAARVYPWVFSLKD